MKKILYAPPTSIDNTQRLKGITADTLTHCSTREARSKLSYEHASRFSCLPLGLISFHDETVLTLAAASPVDKDLATSLRFATGVSVRLLEVEEEVVKTAIFKAYMGDSSALQTVIESKSKEANAPGIPKINIFRKSESRIPRMLESLMDYALARGASDVYLAPRHNGCFLRLRINGEIHTMEERLCSLESHSELISRLKILASLDTTIRNLPQEGGFEVPLPHNSLAFVRLSVLPTLHGEKAVIRLLGKDTILNFESIGFDDMSKHFLNTCINRSNGLVLFTGPTGSGKSTTMYSIMSLLGSKGLHLVSIEDPVEIQLDCISQTEVKESVGMTYARGLRSILRQDPDGILVGEIRDEDSAKIVFHAALTGHLIFSTVHAGDVFEVLLRLKNLGIDAETMAQGVSLIVNQRLVPKLCDSCKVFDLEGSKEYGFRTFKPVGCSLCDYSGFSGRVLASQSLLLTEQNRKQISEGKVRKSALKENLSLNSYVSFDHNLKLLLRKGLISVGDYSFYRDE